MCFSATADLVGGLAVGGIGVDVIRHVGGRRHLIAIAALPLMFGVHEIVEAFVWWGLEGHVPASLGHVATWIYLLFAFVVLPVYVPLAVLLLEPAGRRSAGMAAMAALGGLVSALLLAAMIRGPVTATLGDHHVVYTTDLHAGTWIVSGYVLATCGALLFSSQRRIALYGAVNLVAVAALARLTVDGFASLWCMWAAVTAAAIAFHMRLDRPRLQWVGARPSVDKSMR